MKSIKYLFGALIAVFALTAFSPAAVPTRPTLYSPIKSAIVVDPDAVTLTWYRSVPSPTTSPIATYEVEISASSAVNASDGSFQTTVDSDPAIAAPVPLTATMTYSVTAGTLEYGTTYYWHVRATDISAVTSAWSITGVFRVAIEPPVLTALLPADLLTLRPTFNWAAGTSPSGPHIVNSYLLQISADSGFSTIYRTATILSSASNPTQYIPTTDLLPAVKFYWRVRANNTLLGASDWSTPSSFTTANPPTVPVLVSPSNTRVSTTPTLTWKQVYLQSITTFATYQIEIFNTKVDVDTITPVFTANDTLHDAVSPDPSLSLKTTLSYKVPDTAALAPATTYYWRVKAFNTDGAYSTSSLFTFYTSIVGKIDATKMDPSETAGNVPGLKGPSANSKDISPIFTGTVGDNVNLLSLYPTFTWASTLNAQTFSLQVASYASGNCDLANPNNSKFASLIVNASIPYTQSKYIADFSSYPNYVLCWRIRGNHSLYGSSDWSDVQVFLTANPPSVPVPTNPNDNILTNDNSPRFVWNQVSLPSGTTFAKYEVEVSYSSLFTGYDYPANSIPPYDSSTILPADYPLDAPILPGNTVGNPVAPAIPPQSAFPLYPIVDQSHDPITGLTNTIDEPWYDVEPALVLPAPVRSPLYGAHRYYWRVRSYNDNGEYSAWSVSRSIRITVDRPTNLALTDCAGTTVTSALTPRPCFTWDAGYGSVKGSGIQIATKPTFGTSVIVTASAGTQYQPIKDLPKNVTLYWRVWSINNVLYGVSLPTATGESFTSANPPTTPLPLTPKINTLSPTASPIFTWTRALAPFDPAFAFDHYEIEIAQDSKFAYLVDSASTTAGDDYETTYTPAAGVLTPARTYYWHVRACNVVIPDSQCSSWSSTLYFRTAVAATTLTVPPDVTNPLRPIFEWDAVNDALSYTVQVSKYTSCALPVTGTITTALSFQPKANLAAGTTYYWCVTVNNKYFGPSAKVTSSFTTP